MKDPLGYHYILELYECQGDLSGVNTVGSVMRNTAITAKAHVISDNFHQFEPWGVSGIIVLAESHLSIHTWPEHKYAAVDFFFCDLDGIDIEAGIKYLTDQFQVGKMMVNKIERGIL